MNIDDLKATVSGWRTRILKRHFGPYKKRRRWLEQTQWLAPEKLQAIQLNLLQKMVRHAYETVPYYTKLMDERRIQPADIQCLKDIQRFPIMNKKDVQAAGESIVSTKYNRLLMRTAHTGGTSGLPVPIHRDLRSISNEHAFVRRQFDWAGATIDKTCGYLEGRRVKTFDENADRLYVYDGGMKELTLSIFHLTEQIVPSYVEILKQFKIQFLVGYPSAISVMAKVCLEKGIELPLASVLTTSETLEAYQKASIEKAFDCPVFDYYGSAERVCYIHTCPEGSYHVIPEYGYTELIPAEPPNEGQHRVVSTGFWNMTMPLIRYDIGDLVVKGDKTCSCGRHFETVERIVGRDSHLIVTPSGRIIGASAIECILARVLYGMYDMPVLAGRVIQASNDLIVLEYVPTEKFTAADHEKMLEILRREVPGEMRVEMRRVTSMERTANGKFVSFVMDQHH